MGRMATMEVVLDCSDPEKLTGFWREALGYRLHYSEPSLAVLVPRRGMVLRSFSSGYPSRRPGRTVCMWTSSPRMSRSRSSG